MCDSFRNVKWGNHKQTKGCLLCLRVSMIQYNVINIDTKSLLRKMIKKYVYYTTQKRKKKERREQLCNYSDLIPNQD